MKKIEAIQVLRDCDKKGKYVFSKKDLARLFPDDNEKALTESLKRLIADKLLIRACRGIYVNEAAESFNSRVIEVIAKTLRAGEYNYVSLESMLSEYGLISQIPLDRLTVMTSGRKGTYNTTYGVIEFTHTDRPIDDIVTHIIRVPDRPLRIATEQTAIRDLKRVGRNLDMLELEDNDNE